MYMNSPNLPFRSHLRATRGTGPDGHVAQTPYWATLQALSIHTGRPAAIP
jgi:hypothetical protein